MPLTKGIFALDPGGQTGVAWGVFPLGEGVSDSLTSGLLKGSTTVIGDEYAQIKIIAGLWQSFLRDCVRNHFMEPEQVEFVCEDFVPNLRGITGKEITSPERICWGVEGYRMGMADQFKLGRRGKQVYCPPQILQMPSQAKTFATNKRMREWGLWVVGREHERSAWAHLAYRLAILLKQV